MYDLQPTTTISDDSSKVHLNFEALKETDLLIVETYPGVDEVLVKDFEALGFDRVIRTIDIFKSEEEMTAQMAPFLTEDRVRGRMYFGEAQDFMDEAKLKEAKESISTSEKTLVFGFGASTLTNEGTLVFADLTRWEVQQRYENGMGNFNASNFDEDDLKKIKRGYFVEWPMAEKIKLKNLSRLDYYLDANDKDNYKMLSGDDFRHALDTIVAQPFRLVPYFKPGVWGGNWMKEKFNLPENNSNYAWSFDGVPEENSLNFSFGDITVQSPASNLVLYHPRKLMGEKIYETLGAEFPIRFDYLDTMGGQNLSLQVHPNTDLIRREFGLHYTQSESYYLMDGKEDGVVYLGVKDDVDRKEMFKDLRRAQNGEITFPAEKYVNIFPAKKHDHFLIPPGTIHCSGANTVVLEISYTPNIFTFKLWDWDRLGLDGRPRPTHIDLGERAINWEMNTSKVEKECINQKEVIYEDDKNSEIRTGLTKSQMLDITRVNVTESFTLKNNETVSMINLVEGEKCEVVTKDHRFSVNYGETFIVPACIEEFTIESPSPVMLMRAQVR